MKAISVLGNHVLTRQETTKSTVSAASEMPRAVVAALGRILLEYSTGHDDGIRSLLGYLAPWSRGDDDVVESCKGCGGFLETKRQQLGGNVVFSHYLVLHYP